MTYKLLVVEDKQDVVSRYIRAIEDAGANEILKVINATNKFEAEQIIDAENIDAVIMDLKILPDHGDGEADSSYGAELLKDTLSKVIFPVIVVSATPGVLDSDNLKLPSKLLCLKKETDYDTVAIEHLLSLENLLKIIPELKKAREAYNQDFIKTFWDLYTHWDRFEEKFKNSSRVYQVMKRHITHYLLEKWTAEDDGGALHHSEFYTHHPYRKKIHTGDIVEYAEKKWIVVTAPCDLANNDEPDEITLLECTPIEYAHEEHTSVVRPFTANSPNDKKQAVAKKRLGEFFTKPGISKHYLPSWSMGSSPHNINFKKIKTIPYADAEQLTTITTLNTHFMPYVMQRYGSYVSRLGQPEVNVEDYLAYLITKIPKESSTS